MPPDASRAVVAFNRRVATADSLRIALVAPPMLAVPPPTYAGTERVVGALAEELHRRGHRVTLFAPGDSEVSAELVPTVPRYRAGMLGSVAASCASLREVLA